MRHVTHMDMGWLRLVGSLKLYVSLENIGLFCRALLQKRPILLRSLLMVATPYVTVSVYRTRRWRSRKKAHRYPQQMRWQLQQLQHVRSVVQCGAVWCSVVQCGAVWFSVGQCVAVYAINVYWSNILAVTCEQRVAVRCNALQCLLQCVAVCASDVYS